MKCNVERRSKRAPTSWLASMVSDCSAQVPNPVRGANGHDHLHISLVCAQPPRLPSAPLCFDAAGRERARGHHGVSIACTPCPRTEERPLSMKG
eukprot:5226680-Amphidinium_carterae.1